MQRPQKQRKRTKSLDEADEEEAQYPPRTPDGRYIIVRGKLWRASNPLLSAEERQGHVDRLMDARRAVRDAKRSGDEDDMRKARAAVQSAKEALGERGPVWWTDGAKDWNRFLAKNTPYADWWSNEQLQEQREQSI